MIAWMVIIRVVIGGKISMSSNMGIRECRNSLNIVINGSTLIAKFAAGS